MDYPLFAQQLEALRKAKEKADREVTDGTLIRAGFRRRRRDKDQLKPAYEGRWTNIDWWAPSPLIDFDRNPTNFRIPTLLLTPISKVAVPRGANGETHPNYPDPMASVVEHYGYIERQERAIRTALDHGDYIEREEARDVSETGDISEIRTNIDPDPEKRKAFAKAVYASERLGKTHQLQARTNSLDWWKELAGKPEAPRWVKQSYRALLKAAREHERQARQKGRIAAPIYVPICKVTERQAYDRIVWCEAQEGWDPTLNQLRFKSAIGGRVQYRFVFQLPYWISAEQRLEIVDKIAAYLDDRDFMYVAAIHRPDSHNDPRNYHVHVDAYDRPCEFLPEHGCWDFQLTEKKKNGGTRYPRRQPKIEGFARPIEPPKGSDRPKISRAEHGKKVLREFREIFCQFTNEVLEQTASPLRYHAGTFEDLKLKLRPTKKLGGKAMAAEAVGLRTDAGDRNAEAIWSDVNDAVYRTRELERDEANSLARELLTGIRDIPDSGERQHLEEASSKLANDQFELIERRFQFELAQAEIRMMQSRAETVIREAERRGVRRSGESFRRSSIEPHGNPAIEEAERHLCFIRELGPEPWEIEEEKASLLFHADSLDADRRALVAEIELAASRAPRVDSPVVDRIDSTTVKVDISAIAALTEEQPSGRYDALEIDRLLAWLEKHSGDRERLRLDGLTLAIRAPKAVCSRLEKHIRKPAVRDRVKELIDRRVQQRLQQLSRPTAGKPSQKPVMQPERFEGSGIDPKQVKPAVIPSVSGGAAPIIHAARAATVDVSPEQNLAGLEKQGRQPPAPLEEPAYVRADREFADAELAAGRSVDDPWLIAWREHLTRADTLFFRSDKGEIAVLIEDDYQWVEAVERAVRKSLEYDQIVRYLALMVPLLPPASRYAEPVACFAIQLSADDGLEVELLLHGMAKKKDRSGGI